MKQTNISDIKIQEVMGVVRGNKEITPGEILYDLHRNVRYIVFGEYKIPEHILTYDEYQARHADDWEIIPEIQFEHLELYATQYYLLSFVRRTRQMRHEVNQLHPYDEKDKMYVCALVDFALENGIQGLYDDTSDLYDEDLHDKAFAFLSQLASQNGDIEE